MLLGAHVSIAGGVAFAPANGARVGCEAIQIFSRSPRMLRKTKPLAPEEANAFRGGLATRGVRGGQRGVPGRGGRAGCVRKPREPRGPGDRRRPYVRPARGDREGKLSSRSD